ncbi:MAG: inositol monophosphatase family protein [Ilumatobacteraceae bacterium]
MVRDRMGLLVETADAVASVMRRIDDPGLSGRREGQYVLDLRADEAALAVLRRAGVGVLSEESGLERPDADEIVIIDPVDGSTNASRGVPWYATSLCLVDRDGPAAALVVNLASGVRWSAERGGGASRDGVPIAPTGCTRVAESIIGMNGLPPHHLGYAQSRVFSAVSARPVPGGVGCARRLRRLRPRGARRVGPRCGVARSARGRCRGDRSARSRSLAARPRRRGARRSPPRPKVARGTRRRSARSPEQVTTDVAAAWAHVSAGGVQDNGRAAQDRRPAPSASYSTCTPSSGRASSSC